MSRVAVLAFPLVLFLVSCAAGRYASDGLKHERSGRYFAAGTHYVAALNHDAEHKEAYLGLNRVAQNAYLEQRAQAQALENAQDFPGALNAWIALDRFLAGARAHRAKMDFKTVKVADRIAENRGLAAKQAFDEAERLAAERRFEEAIARYRLTEKYAAREFNNSQARIADAFVGWSNDLVKDGRFRMGAEKALMAHNHDKGNREHTKRAAAIYLALGRHYTQEGLCRQALKDLDQARAIMPAAVSPRDREAAEACAQVPVAIFPFENDTRERLRGVRLEDSLADRTVEKVRASAGQGVRLIDMVELDRILRQQGVSRRRVVSGAVTVISGVRYLVFGRIEQMEVRREPVRPVAKRATYTEKVKCEAKQKPPCEKTGELTYSLIEREAKIRLAGTVKVLDTRTGELVQSLPFEAEEKDEVRYVDSVRKDGRAVERKQDLGSLSVTGADNPAPLMGGERELEDESKMVQRVIQKVADGVGPDIARQADTEPAPLDPGRLDIPRLP